SIARALCTMSTIREVIYLFKDVPVFIYSNRLRKSKCSFRGRGKRGAGLGVEGMERLTIFD
ncbi:MAG: hypothetical protein L6406_07480, partial [Desulfobacterales bacterium]|nr:hypothetical protein [Desulfobacterales bacterium]